MAKGEQSLVIGSPFKTGFYAGLGFFFASILISAIGMVFVVLLGFGTAASFLIHSNSSPKASSSAQPAAYHVSAQASDGQ
ncbi:MAG: hypothetical protein M3O30_18895 [Planctomycetota bacterium]|nr:hypothetical protein [Planctomycetota bacterium]